MRLPRRLILQLAIFVIVAVTSMTVMGTRYLQLPAYLGIGRYTVTVELAQSSGLYPDSNVTYRGVEIGTVRSMRLTPNGVDAVLSLKSTIRVPSDVTAEVHSQSAVGEQYLTLIPRTDSAPPLREGAVIAMVHTTTPPEISSLLESTNRGLEAIPQNNLKTVVDESYTAVGGLGLDIASLVRNSTKLASDARHNLDALTNLIDNSQPMLDSQTTTADAVQSWAAHLAAISGQLHAHDNDVDGVLRHGPGAAEQARSLLERVRPTVPIILANLVSVGQVGITFNANIEQVLVLLPQTVAILQALMVPNQGTKQPYRGAYLDFKLNMNLPPPCTTGYLPTQQQRAPALEDYPERPAGSLYCRIPQDSNFVVRGARNIPCENNPAKRAPTVKMCESDEQYVPLNDGFNWKGDPNATLSGQGIPQLPPGAPPPTAPLPNAPIPPLAVAQYDAATGTYAGPDGRVYAQADLANNAQKEKTWQSMLTSPSK
ncbi:MCE family protein [Mycolicibacterium sp. HS_4_1]